MTKTRIVQTGDSEFVPEVFIKHFLWGGHWEGIQKKDENSFYLFNGAAALLKYCVVATEKEAEDIRYSYIAYLEKKRILGSD